MTIRECRPARSRRYSQPLVAAAFSAVLALSTGLAGCANDSAPATGPGTATLSAHPSETPAGDFSLDSQGGYDSAPPGTPVVVLPKSTPTSLQIPALGVRSPLMRLGLNRDGTLQVPPGPTPAGWFTGSPTPGQLGPSVIAGHVNWDATPGVFNNLARLAPGDEVKVARSDHTTASFRVDAVKTFSKQAFPTNVVYGNISHAALRLITCGGLNKATHIYEANIVVFATLRT